jgi:hypothetical protein
MDERRGEEIELPAVIDEQRGEVVEHVRAGRGGFSRPCGRR